MCNVSSVVLCTHTFQCIHGLNLSNYTLCVMCLVLYSAHTTFQCIHGLNLSNYTLCVMCLVLYSAHTRFSAFMVSHAYAAVFSHFEVIRGAVGNKRRVVSCSIC